MAIKKNSKLLEDFYTPKGIGRWISLTLIFYVKSHKNKQTKPYDPIWSL
jgi:hypothetical protein